MSASVLFYLAALAFFAGAALAWGAAPRRIGALLMVASWLFSFGLSFLLGPAPLGAFVALDGVLIVFFAWIAWIYYRLWAEIIAGFHILALLVHFGRAAGLYSDALYLSALTGLNYLSLLALGGPPLAARAVRILETIWPGGAAWLSGLWRADDGAASHSARFLRRGPNSPSSRGSSSRWSA